MCVHIVVVVVVVVVVVITAVISIAPYLTDKGEDIAFYKTNNDVYIYNHNVIFLEIMNNTDLFH